MPLIQVVLDDAGAVLNELDLIAVGTGPGNFTGIRIAVSAARGLALGLDVPAMGVSGFQQIRGPEPDDTGRQLVSLRGAREGDCLVQLFENGRESGAPRQVSIGGDGLHDIAAPCTILGYGAREIAFALNRAEDGADRGYRGIEGDIGPRADRIALIARSRLLSGETGPPRPAPLYVRPADAAPPKDPAPVLLP